MDKRALNHASGSRRTGMKSLLKCSVAAILLSMAVFVYGCADKAALDFQNISKDARDMLVKLQDIQAISSERETVGGTITEFNSANKAQFIDKNKAAFEDIASRLEKFSAENKDSIWQDDADFLLAIEYLSISLPGNGYHNKAIEKISAFLKAHPAFHIEDWTKTYFDGVAIFSILRQDKIPDADLFGQEGLKLTLNDRVEAFLLFSTVYQYLNDGDLDGANKAFDEIKKENKYEWLNQNIQEVIDAYTTSQFKPAKPLSSSTGKKK